MTTFILTEADAMVPLVRRLLVDVREARVRLCRLGSGCRVGSEWDELDAWRRRLASALDEAAGLGVAVTPGVRCEALFPFEHRWIGPEGDGRIRPARFVYSDENATIRSWYFDGWPRDRRAIPASWWHVRRPGTPPRRRFAIGRQRPVGAA